MKVLYLSKALVVAAYRDKVRDLARSVDVTGVIPASWGRSGIEEGNEEDICLRRLPAILHGYNHFHVYRGLTRVVREVLPDLLHVDEEPYSAVTFQAVRLARREGLPAVFFGAQTLYKRLPPPFGSIRRYVYRNAAGAIAGTLTAAEVIRRGGYQGSMEVIPQFGVDPDRFKPDPSARHRIRARLGVQPEAFLVGYVGRLEEQKGVAQLLQAMSTIEAGQLLVVGRGSCRGGLQEEAAELGLRTRVHFVDHIHSLDVPEWLASLDVLVLPSITTSGLVEQFGRILVEAMSCGVSVVGSDSGEIPRVLGNAGMVFPEGEVEALAAALEGLASDPERRKRLGQLGRDRVLERYTQERVAGETVRFYQGIVEGVR